MGGWQAGIQRLLDMSDEGISLVRVAPLLTGKESPGSAVSAEVIAKWLGPLFLNTLPRGASERWHTWRQRLLDHCVPAVALAGYAVKFTAPQSSLLSSSLLSLSSSSQPPPPLITSSQSTAAAYSSWPGPAGPMDAAALSQMSTWPLSKPGGKLSARRAALMKKERSQDAVARLRALSGQINESSRVARKLQHPVLELWPDTPGVPLSQYVSSVAAATWESRFGHIRDRLEKRARKKEREARLIAKYCPDLTKDLSSKAERPGGLSMSSQPRSIIPAIQEMAAEGVPITMSQPVDGKHSNPRKTKRKKINGFR